MLYAKYLSPNQFKAFRMMLPWAIHLALFVGSTRLEWAMVARQVFHHLSLQRSTHSVT